MEGGQLFSVSAHSNALVVSVIVQSAQNLSQQNRVAQIKAARMASEFLEGAHGKSTTVYTMTSGNSESLSKESSSDQESERSYIGSELSNSISQGSSDYTQESFSDETIQTTMTEIAGKGLQKLCMFKGPDGEKVFSYYIILK